MNIYKYIYTLILFFYFSFIDVFFNLDLYFLLFSAIEVFMEVTHLCLYIGKSLEFLMIHCSKPQDLLIWYTFKTIENIFDI